MACPASRVVRVYRKGFHNFLAIFLFCKWTHPDRFSRRVTWAFSAHHFPKWKLNGLEFLFWGKVYEVLIFTNVRYTSAWLQQRKRYFRAENRSRSLSEPGRVVRPTRVASRVTNVLCFRERTGSLGRAKCSNPPMSYETPTRCVESTERVWTTDYGYESTTGPLSCFASTTSSFVTTRHQK